MATSGTGTSGTSSTRPRQAFPGKPSLVIFDLNSSHTNPMATLAEMKKDGALATIPTIGFASHVQSDVITAARDAGMDEVMARSAFTIRLGDIIKDV